jgi:Domain of unknown function (DUF5667)
MRDNEMDPKLNNVLDDLRSVPPRNLEAAAHGKATFLKQAAIIRSTVSRKQEARHNNWINTNIPVFPRKERSLMFNTILAIVLAVTVFFGGTGITAYAAQDSLPDQTLYPVKTWSEDTILSLTGSPLARLNHVLNFSDRRTAEIAGLLSAGNPIPEKVVARLQNELEQALELAAGMDDPQMVQQLEQIRMRAETQLQTMTALMSGVPESEKPALLQAQVRLQEQIQLASMGQADPQAFRLQVQQRLQNQAGSGKQTPESGNGPRRSATQNPTGTPVPSGKGYGPGSSQPTVTPGPKGPDGSQPTVTPEPKDPGGSQPTGTPGPKGPGTQSPNCTPQHDSSSGNGS